MLRGIWKSISPTETLHPRNKCNDSGPSGVATRHSEEEVLTSFFKLQFAEIESENEDEDDEDDE